MEVKIFNTKKAMGAEAAHEAAEKIRNAIGKNDVANIILATGASQFETLDHLARQTTVDWSKVVMFHLDEYAGMPEEHPASFRKYLKERFLAKVPALKAVYFVEGDRDDVNEECMRLGGLIARHPIDVALVGIGENAHLAFNDPPADFDTEQPYLIVELDEACRRQQMGEGWFATLDDVPAKAISMSIRQIMKSNAIICSVPDKRKAAAVQKCVEGEISNSYPASILQEHPDCTLYLDDESASLLSKKNEEVAGR
ncbi:MAG TPA: glucosamine-6-phosphate deaminase [Chryseolinea sp.]|nr:glucosamine-6-phosphate deaminase [Chryseolinea sp.]